MTEEELEATTAVADELGTIVAEQTRRIRALAAALKRSENLLAALAMGMSQNVTVDLVCDERHLIAVLAEARAALLLAAVTAETA